jgi:hypothetical protein
VADPSPTASQALAVLASATSVELGPVGVAARRTPAFLAYEALVKDRAALAAERPALERMLAAPSPAARLYAALLLRATDPAAGRAALQTLASSTDPLSVAPGGCVLMPTSTLGEAARAFLSPPHFLA